MDQGIKLNKSKQRDAILEYLKSRKDHPSADEIYKAVQQIYPNVSLGTVYRNLSLLCELKQIRKLSFEDTFDHYDYDTSNHCHFICKKCNAVIDVPMDNLDFLDSLASKDFNGNIEKHDIYFYGVCHNCLKNK